MVETERLTDHDPAGESLGGADHSLGGCGRSKPRAAWALAWVLIAFVFIVHDRSPSVTLADSIQFVPAAESLVSARSLDIGWSRQVPGGNIPEGGGARLHGLYQDPHDPKGTYYPSYPLGPALVAVPVVVARHLLHGLGVGRSVRSELLDGTWRLERFVASLVVAVTTGVLYLMVFAVARDRAARPRAAAAAVALTFAFATPAWSTASRALWQHGPSMLFLSVVLLAAVRSAADDRWVAALGPALGLAFVMRPTNAVPIVAFTVWVSVAHRRRLLPFLAGLAVILVPFALVNLRIYGSVLAPYYRPGAQGNGNPRFLEAMLGNLVSPGRGLFVFSPILFAGVVGLALKIRRHEAGGLDLAVWATILGHWLLISNSENWWGGHSIGPRLFSDMVPLLIYAAVPVLLPPWPPWFEFRRLARMGLAASAGLALLLSLGVQFQGATMHSMWCWNVVPANVDNQPSRVWSLRDPQVLAGVRSLTDGRSWSTETVSGGVLARGCA